MNPEVPSRRDIPETCENPDENCEREPKEIVQYAIARSAESAWEDFFLCRQCSSMFYRGTTARGKRLEMRQIYDV